MIESMKLIRYKSFENEEVKFSNGLNVIIGPNGSGKTNFMNAIFFCLIISKRENDALLDDKFDVEINIKQGKKVFSLRRLKNSKQNFYFLNKEQVLKSNYNKQIKNLLADEELLLSVEGMYDFPNSKQAIVITSNDMLIEKADKIICMSLENDKSKICVMGVKNEK